MDSFPSAFNEKKVEIADVLSKKDRFKYSYDFGDNWNHSIKVEEIEEPNEIFNYPLCVDGANACPPEDCGAMAWLGGQFNPISFDANRVNRDGLWGSKW